MMIQNFFAPNSCVYIFARRRREKKMAYYGIENRS
jgi:hypothetical protein